MNRDEKRRRIKKVLAEIYVNRAALHRLDLGASVLDIGTWGRLTEADKRKLCMDATYVHRSGEALWRELYNLSR